MSEPILVLNCGSSSINFAVFDASVEALPRKSAWSGRIEGVGSENPTLVDGNAAPLAVALDARAPYHAALQRVRSCVERRTGGRPPAVIAHRVVHGCNKYSAPVRVDARVLADLESFIPLAPLHQPRNGWRRMRRSPPYVQSRRTGASRFFSSLNERGLRRHDAER